MLINASHQGRAVSLDITVLKYYFYTPFDSISYLLKLQ